MSDSEIKLFYAQSSEVKNRILAPDEHLSAIDTGAYYVAGPDGKPQAVLTATTSDQGIDIPYGPVAHRQISNAETSVTAQAAKRAAMINDLKKWVYPTHTAILDPRRYAGMAPITSGALTCSHVTGTGELYGQAVRLAVSGATAGAAVELVSPGWSELAQEGSPVRCGPELHFAIKCSDWSQVSSFEIYFCAAPNILYYHNAVIVRTSAGTGWGYSGHKDPNYAARWNGITRDITIHASALTPSAAPNAPPDWAKQGTRYFDLRSFRFVIVTTGAVTIDIQRIYSAEWPVGVVVPIFDASYQSAIAQAIAKMTSTGWNFGSSLHTMTAANEDPTPDTLKAVQAAGGDLFFHHHGVTLDAARLPVSMDGRHTANQIRRYFAEQLEYLRLQGYREIPRSKFGLQFQMGKASDSNDVAGLYRESGIHGVRGYVTDAEFGAFGYSDNTARIDYHTWVNPLGRYNLPILQMYVNRTSPTDDYYGPPAAAGQPQIRDFIAAAAKYHTACWMYVHRINNSPTSIDITPTFFDQMISDIASKSADLIVLSPSEYLDLTYLRDGPFRLRWDGVWVDNAGNIAF